MLNHRSPCHATTEAITGCALGHSGTIMALRTCTRSCQRSNTAGDDELAFRRKPAGDALCAYLAAYLFAITALWGQ
jgi:hypothetical protein